MDKKRRGITDMFDIPAEGIAGQTRITITGSRRVLIENHRGILEYSICVIAVNCGGNIVAISGENLELASMTADALLICGDVRNVAFS